MSNESNITVEMNKIVVKPLFKSTAVTPIIVKKDSKIKLVHGENPNSLLLKNIKFGPANTLYKEDVIFQSQAGTGIRDSPVKLTIVNRLDLIKKVTRTVITYYDQLNGKVMSIKTSDHVARFLGQSNYETVLFALCSIKEEEMKIKAIIALLTQESLEGQSVGTVSGNNKPSDSIMDVNKEQVTTAKFEDKICQTAENSMNILYKYKQKKRIRRKYVPTPYVVQDIPKKPLKKVIIHPDNIQAEPSTSNTVATLQPPLPAVVSKSEMANIEDDNFSITESLCSDSFLHDPQAILDSIGQNTSESGPMQMVKMISIHDSSQKHYILVPNCKPIEVPVKPLYPFHMATPEILKTLSEEDKVKVVSYQAYLDYKLCSQPDDDGYLPLHNAVLNNDVDLLRRQCVVLRYRQQSLDTTANNLTALQMSFYQDVPQCTALLLQNGADPLRTDEEHRICLHHAAESTPDCLRAVVDYARGYASEILQDHEELWKDEYETKSKEELAAILLNHMSIMVDSQGYTALMIAAKGGNYTGVQTLLEAARECVNMPTPNSGHTALFLAVEGACYDACNRGNRSKVSDNFRSTISLLIENGANLRAATHAGTTINDLLAENINTELSDLFAAKVTAKYPGESPSGSNYDSYMLLKDQDQIRVTEMNIEWKASDRKGKQIVMKDILGKSDYDKYMLLKDKDQVKVTEIKTGKKATDLKIKKNKRKTKPTVLENIALSNAKPTVLENIALSNAKPTVLENVALSKTKPTVLENIALSNAKPTVLENIALSKTKPTVLENIALSNAKPTVLENIALSKTKPTVLENIALSNAKPVVLENIALSNAKPTVLENVALNNAKTTVLENVPLNNAKPSVLENKASRNVKTTVLEVVALAHSGVKAIVKRRGGRVEVLDHNIPEEDMRLLLKSNSEADLRVLLKPKEKLVPVEKIKDTVMMRKNNTRSDNSKPAIECERRIVDIDMADVTNNGAVVKQKIEAVKRKSESSAGPSEKKTKEVSMVT